jgi:hypothetical protein
MNNSKDYCKEFRELYEIYFSTSLSVFNIIFNSFNIITFLKLILKDINNDFYKYLMIKSIADFYIGLRYLFRDVVEKIIFYPKIKSNYYFFMTMYIIFLKYFVSVAGLVSRLSECFSSLDRLITCMPICKNMKKIRIKIAFLILILFWFIFYVFKFFEYRVIEIEKKNLTNKWYQVISDDEKFYVFTYIHNIVKDLLSGFISLILNLITFIFMKKAIKNKMSLRQKKKNEQKRSQSIFERADFKILIMITITSVVSFIAHFTNFLYEARYFDEDKCFKTFGSFFYEISFAGNFIIYMKFNRYFRKVFLNLFRFKTNLIEP